MVLRVVVVGLFTEAADLEHDSSRLEDQHTASYGRRTPEMDKALREWALLEPGARRSEHPEAARFAMRPVTGAFLDPSIESAFGAHLFHVSFPIHVFLFGFLFVVSVWITAVAPKDEVGAWKIILLGTVLGMAGRVLLHVSHWSMEDTVIAQRIGSRSWLALMAVCNLVLVADLLANPAIECLAAERDILMVSAVPTQQPAGLTRVLTPCSPPMLCQPLTGLALALVNGSHGMTFAPKICMIGFLILVDLIALAICTYYGVTTHFQAWGGGARASVSVRVGVKVKVGVSSQGQVDQP